MKLFPLGSAAACIEEVCWAGDIHAVQAAHNLCAAAMDARILHEASQSDEATPHLKPEIRNPKPETRNPKPETQNPKPETRNPKP